MSQDDLSGESRSPTEGDDEVTADHEHHKPFSLTVVVNGDAVHPDVTRSTRLSKVLKEALRLANAVGRQEDQWEIKTEEGVVLDETLSLKQAGIKTGATLYASLRTGAAGDAARTVLVDPSVSRLKFDAELARYRAVEDGLVRRGQWVLAATFPEVFVVYGAQKTQPHLIAFGAVLDFTNFDIQPPSVKIVDPFTRIPYTWATLPEHAKLYRQVPAATPDTPKGAPIGAVTLQPMMQAHDPKDVPFLCVPGVREYHEHPAHTGDDWLIRRGTGEGTLYHLLDVLYQHGPFAMTALQATTQVLINPSRL